MREILLRLICGDCYIEGVIETVTSLFASALIESVIFVQCYAITILMLPVLTLGADRRGHP